jgi:DNA-directed RNA polymerase subunit alpha
MRIRWRNFDLPSRVVLDKDTATSSYGRFVVEPFERGFGTTIGNGLRRVLLSSIEGTAVTSVKVDGVLHEFSTIDGVYEDVTHIILNIKKLRVKLLSDGPVTLNIDVKRKGEVTAADIQGDHNVEIVTKDLHICRLTDSVRFACQLKVEKGRGYRIAEENITEDQELGIIPVDSVFSPIYRVKYGIEATRVGKFTNYDRLVLEIWTDGTVEPEMALVEASKIYRKHLNPFVQYFEMQEDVAVQEEAQQTAVPGGTDMDATLDKSIEELELSVRAKNCLDSENITTIRQLVALSEPELLKVRNFGKTSLKEVKSKLANLGLSLGMALPAAKPS